MEPREHNGHKITLTDNWTFSVSGPLIDDSMRRTNYDTLIAAQDAIDERVKQQNRQDRVKLSIPVWLDDGRRGTITGVHGGHLKATGVDHADTVYPSHPHLSKLLIERKKIRDREKAINVELQKYRVSTASGYGVRDYDGAVADLQKRLNEASAKAIAELPVTP